VVEIWRDPRASPEARVSDLLGRMSIEEKTAQLGAVWLSHLVRDDRFDPALARQRMPHGIGQVTRIGASTGLRPEASARVMNAIQRHAVEHTRLGIPVVVHEEAVAGYCARDATVFPQAIGLAASFDPGLVQEVAAVAGAQMRAVGARHALSPVLDVARDPRWGRLEETYGESPELCGVLGTAYVRGLQGPDLRHGVVATGKHFLGYGLSVGGRNQAPVQIGPRELREVYAEPFAAAIRDAGLASIMNSYSAVDGAPCAASREILTTLLREELGFSGTVVADYWSVVQLTGIRHAVASDGAEAAALALEAGLDVELPALELYARIPALLAQGRLEPAVVDAAVARVLRQKLALGLFESPYVDAGRAPEVFDTPDQRALALRAAREAVVVLANDGVLPLDGARLRRLAVLGPGADDRRMLQGDYHYPAHLEIIVGDDPARGSASAGGDAAEMLPEAGGSFAPGHDYVRHVTPLAGLRAALGEEVEVVHHRGCHVSDAADAALAEAAGVAASADVAVVCVGGLSGLTLSATVGEGRDAASLGLTGAQADLVRAVAATGTRTVLVVQSGRVHTLEELLPHTNALLQAWPGGEEGGAALADVLLGRVDATGRLPVSLPRHVGQVPLHHDQRSRAERVEFHGAYVDQPVEPLFPFGHGLGFTRFGFPVFSVRGATARDPIEVEAEVVNQGERTGTAVPQLYVRDVVASTVRPLRQLVGFARVELAPGAAARLRWTVHPSKLALLDPALRWVTEPGEFRFQLGLSSAEIVGEASLALTGAPAPTRQRDVVATRLEIRPVP